MSYLNAVRLHFAGRFRADVSTVNNDRDHYNNQTFTLDDQRPETPGSPNGWWQPAGTGAWRLVGCAVTSACRNDGSAATTSADDAVVGVEILDSNDKASAKLADLDPDQQGVSMIFGLSVRLVDGSGQLLVKGDFEAVPFFDLRFTRSSTGNDGGACAYFQSVLTNLEWGNVTASPCLTQMRQMTTDALSIKFMTDKYVTNGPQRGYGRIVGTIGPFFAGEPRSFLMGRHLAPPAPALPFAPADCLVDRSRRKVLIDIGNTLQIDMATGEFANAGTLSLIAGNGPAATSLGTIDHAGAGNYAKSAGIYELPAERILTDAELAAVISQPLQLLAQSAEAAAPVTIAAESTDGIYVRAEPFVLRLDPGAQATVTIIASKFGEPYGGATPVAQTQAFSVPGQSPLPRIVTEPQTDGQGRAKLTVTGVDAKNPRSFIDGQVYAILFGVREAAVDPSDFDAANFISLLMFNGMQPVATPQWSDVQPILEQYAHLYPRPHGPSTYAPFSGLPPSHPVVDLNDYASVAGFARHITWALSLPIDHPSHMPVTRDLSGAKRALLLKWLRAIGVDGMPRRSGSATASKATIEGLELTPAQSEYNPTAFSVKRALIQHAPRDDI